jgi:hypothetical protein
MTLTGHFDGRALVMAQRARRGSLPCRERASQCTRPRSTALHRSCLPAIGGSERWYAWGRSSSWTRAPTDERHHALVGKASGRLRRPLRCPRRRGRTPEEGPLAWLSGGQPLDQGPYHPTATARTAGMVGKDDLAVQTEQRALEGNRAPEQGLIGRHRHQQGIPPLQSTGKAGTAWTPRASPSQVFAARCLYPKAHSMPPRGPSVCRAGATEPGRRRGRIQLGRSPSPLGCRRRHRYGPC